MFGLLSKTVHRLWYPLLAAGFVLGTVAIALVMMNGHAHEFNAWEPVWGLLIATYEFFLLASAGLCLLTGLGHLSGLFGGFDRLARKALLVSLAALLVGVATALIEITHPLRLSLFATTYHRLHPAVLNAAGLLLLYAGLLGIMLVAIHRQRRRLVALFGLLGFVLALAGFYRTGEILTLLGDQPRWHHPFLLSHITLTSVILGSALLVLIPTFGHWLHRANYRPEHLLSLNRLSRVLFIVVALLMAHVGGRSLIGLWGPPSALSEITHILFFGPLAYNFWGMEVVVGMVLPLGLLLMAGPDQPHALSMAGVLVVLGQFFIYCDWVFACQFAPLSLGAVVQLTPALPCLTKTAVVVGAFSIFLILWTFLEKACTPVRR